MIDARWDNKYQIVENNESGRKNLPLPLLFCNYLSKSDMKLKTTKRIPPPGPKRMTFGAKPFHKAVTLWMWVTRKHIDKSETRHEDQQVQSTNEMENGPFFLGNQCHTGNRPVVLGNNTRGRAEVLNTSFDDISRCVQDCTESTSDGTSHKVLEQFSRLGFWLG